MSTGTTVQENWVHWIDYTFFGISQHSRNSGHLSLLLVASHICCVSAEKKHLGFWHQIISSPQMAYKADILLSLQILPCFVILSHFCTSIKPGLTLLINRVHPIYVVPCERVNLGSNRARLTFLERMQCPLVSRVLRAASHIGSVVAPLMVYRCTFSLESGV